MIEKNLLILLNAITDAKSVGVIINPGTDDEATFIPNDADAVFETDLTLAVMRAMSRNLKNIHPEISPESPKPEKLAIKEYRVEDNSRLTLLWSELDNERHRLKAVQALSGQVMTSYYQGAIDTISQLLYLFGRRQ
jgi:hypothetical protein